MHPVVFWKSNRAWLPCWRTPPSVRMTSTRRLLLRPIPRVREGVSVLRNLPFSRRAGRVLKMDIYRGPDRDVKRPGLVFLHGGAWVLGDKREQGLPLCHHLATLGWVCANANYRLSPGATYPDHVVDASNAVSWLREHCLLYTSDAADE